MAPLNELDDPYALLEAWMAEGEESEPRVHDALQLATVDGEQPRLRTVLLKSFSPELGLVFYTNYGSAKGDQLRENPRAAGLVHHKSRERQIRAEGVVSRLSSELSDAYWASRGRGSQLGAIASRQSRGMAHPNDLALAVERVEREYEGRDVPRPAFWGGYSLMPERFEFWQGMPDRLHVRRVFDRAPTGWQSSWIQP